MKSKIYLILFALFVFSCSSDSSSDDGSNNDGGNNNNSENALLVSEILSGDQGQDGSMNFNYDGNKLTYISHTSDIDDNTLLTFIYTDNKISRIDRSHDTSQGIERRWNFSYDNQNRLNYYEYCYLGNNNECDYLSTFSIAYGSNNTVTQNYIYGVGTDYEDTGTVTLQLDNNGNIIGGTETYENIDDNGNSVTYSVSGTLQYDNFNSPFKNITGMNALILLEIISSEFFYLLGFNAFNNCVSQNFEYSDGDDSDSVTYAYDYNDDNYPRQIIVSENNSSYDQIYDISYY